MDDRIVSLNLNEGLNMPLRQILGLAGSIILFIGVFTPIFSVPIIGGVNYLANGRVDGVFILILAASSIVFTLTKRYKFLLFTGIGSSAIFAFTIVIFHVGMSQVQSQMKELRGNPFAGFGEAMLSTVQPQWGWAVLIVGAVLLIAAGLLRATSETNQFTMSNHTNSEYDSACEVSGALKQPARKSLAAAKVITFGLIVTVAGILLGELFFQTFAK